MKAQIVILKTRIKMQKGIIVELRQHVVAMREVWDKEQDEYFKEVTKLKQDLAHQKSKVTRRDEQIAELEGGGAQ